MVSLADLKRWRSSAAYTLGALEGGPIPDDVRKLVAGLMRTTWNELTTEIDDGQFAPAEGEVEFDKVMGLVMS